MYQEDGTKPDYDNQPFELIVEKKELLSETEIWTTSGVGTVTVEWKRDISGIKSITPDFEKSYIATVIPS